MVAYPIDCAPSKNWIVFTAPNSDGFPPEYGYNISITLGGVCLAFNDFFGKNVLHQYPNLTVLNSKETPQFLMHIWEFPFAAHLSVRA